jgi:hypothetical protein
MRMDSCIGFRILQTDEEQCIWRAVKTALLKLKFNIIATCSLYFYINMLQTVSLSESPGSILPSHVGSAVLLLSHFLVCYRFDCKRLIKGRIAV